MVPLVSGPAQGVKEIIVVSESLNWHKTFGLLWSTRDSKQPKEIEISQGHSNQLGITASQLESGDSGAAIHAAARVLLLAPGRSLAADSSDGITDLERQLGELGLKTQVFAASAPFQDEGTRDVLSVLDELSSSFHYLKRLFRCLANFEVLHIAYSPAASFAAVIVPAILMGRFLGKKVVLDYRSPVLLNRIGGGSLMYQKLWQLCDRVLVPSAYQRQLVISLGGRAEYFPAVVPVKEIRTRVIKDLQPRIIVASDLEREHNVACTIRACAIVKQKYPRTELVIVGSGPQRAALRRLVQTKNIPGVTFHGNLPRRQRWDCFERSDLFINCSTVDYLSSSTVEALAFGLPVLTTPISSGVDVFRSRENVMLLTYNDHAGLAEKIIQLVEDPELTEKLSHGSRLTAEKLAEQTSDKKHIPYYSHLSRKM